MAATPDPQSTQIPRTGKIARWWKIFRGPFLLFLALAIIAALFGYGYDNFSNLKRVVQGGPPATIIIDQQDGLILMLEQSGDSSRVIVEDNNQANWQLVSKTDLTAASPSLAQDGSAVAYTSQQNGGEIVLASLIDSARQAITAPEIKNADTGAFRLCPWSPTAWSPDTDQMPDHHQVAFFACDAKLTASVVMVAKINKSDLSLDDISPVSDSNLKTTVERQVAWPNETEVFVSTPAFGDQQAATVQTFSIP